MDPRDFTVGFDPAMIRSRLVYFGKCLYCDFSAGLDPSFLPDEDDHQKKVDATRAHMLTVQHECKDLMPLLELRAIRQAVEGIAEFLGGDDNLFNWVEKRRRERMMAESSASPPEPYN